MGCGAGQQRYEADELDADQTSGAHAQKLKAQGSRVSVQSSASTATKPIATIMVEGRLGDAYEIDDRELLKRRHFCLVTNKSTKKLRACRKMDKKRMDYEKIQEIADIMGLLDHPNTMQLYEVFQDKLHFYLIQEHCRGGNLFDHLIGTQHGMNLDEGLLSLHLNEPLVAEILKQVLTGVNYMHLRRVCHRNLDFQRLMLLERVGMQDGDVPLPKATVKICNFDLACRFQPNKAMTEDMRGCAYLPAMAPELLSCGNYNELCDTWTCGVFAYMLLSGELPFGGLNHEHPKELLERIARGAFLTAKLGMKFPMEPRRWWEHY